MRSNNKPTNFRLNRDSPLAYGLAVWLPIWDGRLVDHVQGIEFSLSPNIPPIAHAPAPFAPTRQFFNTNENYLVSAVTPVTAAPLTMACWFATYFSSSTRDLVGIYNTSNTTDFFQLQSAGSASDTIRARTGDSGGTSNGQSATGSTEKIWSLGTARFGAANNRVGQCDLGGTGTSTGSRTPSGLNRIGIGAQLGLAETAFFDGWISDVCIWNRSLSDAEIFKLYDPITRWELYEEIRRQWFVAAVVGGPTLYIETQGGSLGLAGGITKRTAKALAGTVAPTGTDAKRTGKAHGGAVAPAGVLASLRVVLLVLGGSVGFAGSLAKRTAKNLAGGLTSAGSLTKQTAKAWAGAVAPAGAVAKRTNKIYAGGLDAAGGLAKRINKVFAGGLASTGAALREKIGPALATVFLTFARRPLTLTVAERNNLTVARRRLSLTVAARNVLTFARRRLGLTMGDK